MTRSCTVQATLAVLALLSLVPVAARAQGYPAEGQRTVEWYAAHPGERDRMRRVCLNDPGHLERTPDCINASRGDLAATAAPQARNGGGGGGFLAPLPPSYWAARPNERALQLAYCRRMAPMQQSAAGCGPVFQSLSMTPETR